MINSEISGDIALIISSKYICKHRDASRFAPSQWEKALLCKDISHWLGANHLEYIFEQYATFIYSALDMGKIPSTTVYEYPTPIWNIKIIYSLRYPLEYYIHSLQGRNQRLWASDFSLDVNSWLEADRNQCYFRGLFEIADVRKILNPHHRCLQVTGLQASLLPTM